MNFCRYLKTNIIFSSSSMSILSRSSSFLSISLCETSISRIRVNTRIMWMFTLIVLSLCSTPDSIAIPCSVKALGGVRRPPQVDLPIWNSKFSNSSFVSWNMKSPGKRAIFLNTALSKCPQCPGDLQHLKYAGR